MKEALNTALTAASIIGIIASGVFIGDYFSKVVWTRKWHRNKLDAPVIVPIPVPTRPRLFRRWLKNREEKQQ